MRGLIVDCWNLPGGRVEQTKRVLTQYPVDHVSQVSGEAEDEWAAAAEEVRQLLEPFEFVLLHVGDGQKFKLKLLDEICQARPVLCYTGGSVAADIEAHCQLPGLHVLCPGMFGRTDAGTLPLIIRRWLEKLGSKPSSESSVSAWREVRQIDPAKETKIEQLESRLSVLLREHKWSPETQMSPDLKQALQAWRNESGVKW